MTGVLIGFGLVWLVIGIGYILARTNALGANAQPVLNRLAFFVASPALLFETIARADFHITFRSGFWIVATSALSAAVIAAALYLLRHRKVSPDLVVSTMSSSYINANNLGLPVAVYVLGNAALAAPIVIFQLAIYQPLFVVLIEVARKTGATPWRKVLISVITNPLLLASLAGTFVAGLGLKLPELFYQPFQLIGAAAVPAMLLAFGLSLHGTKPFQHKGSRADVVIASAVKLIAQPVAAYLIARFGFSLSGPALFAAVVLASLPTAQNVFVIASRYSVAVSQTKDTVLLTTTAAIPVMLAIAALLS